MAYEITATRKRPNSFDQLAGQDFVSATLKASIASGRLAHAYLFSGPRGCGKTSTARILARSLNCEGGPRAEPCGSCDSCTAIARGASIDVIEIDGASNTSVENVRQIKDEVLFPPSSSTYKIYIIDEVHMLSNSAFNALLKTIEEPPPYIVFIFATTELHKVPATIKSRCQQFNFRLIPLDVIRERLESAAADLGIQAEPEALLWIAREATGSLRDAYTLFDQVAAFSDGLITAAKIRDKLGLVGPERLAAILLLCARSRRAEAMESLDSILSSGVSVEQFVNDTVNFMRVLLLVASGVERDGLLGLPRASIPDELLAAFDPPRIERSLYLLFELHRNLRYSVNPRFELELALARLCEIGSYVSPGQLSNTLAALKRLLVEGRVSDLSHLVTGSDQDEGPEQKKNTERVDRAADGPAPEGRDREPEVVPETTTDFGFQPAAVQASADDLLIDEAEPSGATGPSEGTGSTSSPGGDEPAGWLQELLVAALAKKRMVLAASLERSSGWYIQGDSLRLSCANAYDANTVLSESNLLARKASEAAGRVLRISIAAPESQTAAPRQVDEQHDTDDDSAGGSLGEADDPVAIVERVFRGKRISE